MRNLDKAGAVRVTLWDTLAPDINIWTNPADALASAIGEGGSGIDADRPTLKAEVGEFPLFRFVHHLGGTGVPIRVELVFVFPTTATPAERSDILWDLVGCADQFWPEEKKEETATEETTATEAGE
jgi:hypothetical protein